MRMSTVIKKGDCTPAIWTTADKPVPCLKIPTSTRTASVDTEHTRHKQKQERWGRQQLLVRGSIHRRLSTPTLTETFILWEI